MKQQDITKICADSLRAFVNDNHGIKLGAAHAHELVAASFGYKSKAALLADAAYPLSNLTRAKIIVMPFDTFIDQRRTKLEGLSQCLPDTKVLKKAIYSALPPDSWSGSVFRPFEDPLSFLKFMAEDRGVMLHGTPFSGHVHHIVDEKHTDDGVVLTVKHAHKADTGNMYVNAVTTVELPRVAGRIGYGLARTSEKRDSSTHEVLTPRAEH